MIRVSIVMRSMNDIGFIERAMQAIFEQDFTDFELINVDSGSSDGTYEIVKQYNPDKSYQIKPSEYIPGKVLNNAVAKCSGEIIVFNNSDCIPCNREWLGNLIRPLLERPDVAAVFANQLSRPDANPLVAKDNSRAFGDGVIASSWKHFFSLASSATRKAILLETPFNEKIQYSEDLEWSWRLKQHGSTIVYVPNALVEHSHNYTLRQVWKRFYNEGVADAVIFGRDRDCGFCRCAAAASLEMMRDVIFLLRSGRLLNIPYGLIYRTVQRYSYRKGFRNKLAGKI
jgi:rhamnosyltransferase